MKTCMLVVDVGTQSLRASLIDKTGKVLAFSRKKYDPAYYSPREGYAEQDADFYLHVLCQATNDLKNTNSNIYDNLKGFVIDGFRDTSVILDENKKPIRNAILWLDQRVTVIPHMRNLKFYEKALFNLVGMYDTVKYNAERTVSYWIKENEPQNWAKMKYYCPISAYFNYKITNNLAVSGADTIGHYPINFKKGTWLPSWHPKIDVYGIPLDKVPPVVPVGSVIGTVSKEFSLASGIPEGINVYASGSDKACETFGNGCTDEDVASISLGTACTIDVVSHKYSEPETFLPSYQAPYKGYYDLEVQIYRGLWMVKWFTDNFGSVDIKDATKAGMTIEDYLNMKITKIHPGCDGLVLQPYWGPGLKRPNAKGSIIGFSGVHTRYHLYRAIIEGIAFALRDGLDEIRKKTHKMPKYLVVSGGGSSSDIFCHIIADVFGIDVHRALNAESSTLGGAMSGFISNGTYKTPQETIKNMVVPGDVIPYDKGNHEIYDRLYKKVYLKIYPSLKTVYNNCKHFYLESNGEE